MSVRASFLVSDGHLLALSSHGRERERSHEDIYIATRIPPHDSNLTKLPPAPPSNTIPKAIKASMDEFGRNAFSPQHLSIHGCCLVVLVIKLRPDSQARVNVFFLPCFFF